MTKTQTAMEEGIEEFEFDVDLSNKDTARWSTWLKAHQKSLIK